MFSDLQQEILYFFAHGSDFMFFCSQLCFKLLITQAWVHASFGVRFVLCVFTFSLTGSYSGHILPMTNHRNLWQKPNHISSFEAYAFIMSAHIFWPKSDDWSSPKSMGQRGIVALQGEKKRNCYFSKWIKSFPTSKVNIELRIFLLGFRFCLCDIFSLLMVLPRLPAKMTIVPQLFSNCRFAK